MWLWIILIFLILGVVMWWQQPSDLDRHHEHLQSQTELVPFSRETFRQFTQSHQPRAQRVAIVSGGVWDKPLFYTQVTRRRLRNYCNLHGYAFLPFDQKVDPSRALYWQKVSAIRNAMKSNQYDAVVWMDDDIYVTNMQTKIEHFLEAADGDVLICNEVAFPMNAGLLVFRNTPRGRRMLETFWGAYDQFPQRHTAKYHEQDVFQHYYFHRGFKPYVSVFPRNLLQTVHFTSPYHEGDFCVHFAGIPKPGRDVYAQMLENDQSIQTPASLFPIFSKELGEGKRWSNNRFIS